MSSLKNAIKPIAWVGLAVVGFAYDWYRFARYAGARYRPAPNRLQYSAAKTYHPLEKSLSLSGRTSGHGRGAVSELTALLAPRVASGQALQYQERVGLKVLSEFVGRESAAGEYGEVRKVLAASRGMEAAAGGAMTLEREDIQRGKLEDPAAFFGSRHSVRDFGPHAVPDESVTEAVSLALSTPSVCNRQGWHVYRTSHRETIARALSFQNGNRGFTERIPTLLVVTADLNAFDTSSERYQHWIDGGMFAMTLVWAFHAMGLGACCLNWSKGVRDDRRFRRALRIAPHHSVVMMLAVGELPENISVCVSARTPDDQKMSELLSW